MKFRKKIKGAGKSNREIAQLMKLSKTFVYNEIIKKRIKIKWNYLEGKWFSHPGMMNRYFDFQLKNVFVLGKFRSASEKGT